ncbi:MAG: VOC family protein [Acidobacteria bacterium]|nr:VOC family protein [Acidobacteriota bacterium]
MLANRSMPRSTVIPVLDYPDLGEAIDWLCRTFGFTLRLRIGDHRAQLNVGDGAVVLGAAPGKTPTAESHSIMVRVEDVDAHYARSVAEGAMIVGPPVSYPYGERQYGAVDLAGHRWDFSQSVADVDPLDWGGTPVEL